PGFAAIGTLIWSLLDRRTEYWTLYQWFRSGLRWSLGVVIWHYALFKFPGSQWRPATGPDLLTRVGDFQARATFWPVMSYSMEYFFFTALGEAAGALLLLWRRTATLGAMI